MSQSIDRHLERYLGPITRGWAATDPGGVQLCLFEERPFEGMVTYTTLGLSRHKLAMPRGREVRQELLLSVAVRFANDDLAKMLDHVAERLLRDHRALLRGEVAFFGQRIARSSACDSLYVSLPIVFPEGLATCEETQPPTVFAWLVPIHPAEAALVNQHGWSELEVRWERADPDLFDLERSSVV